MSDTAAGQLEIDNTTSVSTTLTIDGQGTPGMGIDIDTSLSWNTRIFEIVGTGAAGVTVALGT